MLLYLNTGRRNLASGDSRTLTARDAQKGGKKRSNINKSIAAAVDKQVEKTLSAVVKANDTEAFPDSPTDDQSRAYIVSLMRDTKAETTPAKPSLK